MISEKERRFIRACIREISTWEDIQRHEFDESTFSDIISKLDYELDDIPNYLRYFNKGDYKTCKNCDQIEEACKCESQDLSDTYFLDVSVLVDEICENLKDYSDYIDSYIDKSSGNSWTIVAESETRGEITYIVTEDTDRFTSLDCDPKKGVFAISIKDVSYIDSNNCVFAWYQIIKPKVLDNIDELINDIRNPIYEHVSEQSGAIVTENIESIRTSAKRFGEFHGYDQRQPTKECRSVAGTVNLEKSVLCLGNDEDSILLCRCSMSDSYMHTHLVSDNQLIDIPEEHPAKIMASRLSSKISARENIQDKERNLQSRTKSLLLAAGVINAIPILNVFSEYLDLTLFSNPKVIALLYLFGLVIGGTFLLAVLLPTIRGAIFRWNIKKLRDRVSQGMLHIF